MVAANSIDKSLAFGPTDDSVDVEGGLLVIEICGFVDATADIDVLDVALFAALRCLS